MKTFKFVYENIWEKNNPKDYKDFWVKGIKYMELILFGERRAEKQAVGYIWEWPTAALMPSTFVSLTCGRHHSLITEL